MRWNLPRNKAGALLAERKTYGGPPRTRTGTPRGARFSYHFGFRRPRRVRGLDCPFTVAAFAALGAARPVSTPSRLLGLGSGLAVKPSPTLSGSAPGISTGALNFPSESRASTNSARRPLGLHSMPIRSRQRRPVRRQSRCREQLPPSNYRRTFGFPGFRRVSARFAFAARFGARPFGRSLGAAGIAALLTLTAAVSIVLTICAA